MDPTVAEGRHEDSTQNSTIQNVKNTSKNQPTLQTSPLLFTVSLSSVYFLPPDGSGASVICVEVICTVSVEAGPFSNLKYSTTSQTSAEE